MPKKKRFKKINWGQFAGDVKKRIFKRLSGILLVLVFLIASSSLLKAYIHKSNYFRLKVIEAKDALTNQDLKSVAGVESLRSYMNKNIFEIDLKRVAASLEAMHPDAKEVIVRRALPDKVIISLRRRIPIALVSDKKLYPVDDEAFVFPSADPNALKELPTILGVDIRYEDTKGKRCESKNLKTALDLLSEFKRMKFLPRYSVDTIDASDIRNLSFYLKNGLEVKIGCENLKERLEVLWRTLRNPRLVTDRIKYIDVRFKDIVIGPK